ncbi:MAG: hypothetical protein M1813_003929 [Trichoglossum hirsutum]|nr:MAG: hypothetical protein M1813_003929 [Trichoglossum hirsutum]
MFPSRDRKPPQILIPDGKRVSWVRNETFRLPTVHDEEITNECDDTCDSLTCAPCLRSKYLCDSGGSAHETSSTVYSGDTACGSVLSFEMPSQSETNGDRSSSESIASFESAPAPTAIPRSGFSSYDLLSALREMDELAPGQVRASRIPKVDSNEDLQIERLPTVHEELTVTNKFKSDNTVKARKVPLWQKMENKVVVTRVKKAKELLNYKKQIMQGSTEEVDEEEIKGEGFVDREIWKLREELGVYTTTYGVYDSHPPHPSHHQTWTSKNLRCTTCTVSCGICNATCCKYNEAKIAEREAYLGSEEMVAATRVIRRIQIYLHTGFDLPTFLRCTECETLVCPDCCGMCPVKMCQDLKCNKCCEDPWEKCEWHDEIGE